MLPAPAMGAGVCVSFAKIKFLEILRLLHSAMI
jgi:hypothetical protein